MKRAARIFSTLAFAILPTGVFGKEFKPYPGAKVDEQATKEAREATGMDTTIYTTTDSFDKVHAFYKDLGKEYKMPAPEGPAKLRSGGVLKEGYFIFDGAADITTSKSWIKIQRPFLGRVKTTFPPDPKYLEDIYEDIRDVTVIVK